MFTTVVTVGNMVGGGFILSDDPSLSRLVGFVSSGAFVDVAGTTPAEDDDEEEEEEEEEEADEDTE